MELAGERRKHAVRTKCVDNFVDSTVDVTEQIRHWLPNLLFQSCNPNSRRTLLLFRNYAEQKRLQVWMTKRVFIFPVLNGTLELMERVLSMGTSFIRGVWDGSVVAREQFSLSPLEADSEKRCSANWILPPFSSLSFHPVYRYLIPAPAPSRPPAPLLWSVRNIDKMFC